MSEQYSFKDLLSQISSTFSSVLETWAESAAGFLKTSNSKSITISDWNRLVELLSRTEAYVRGVYGVVSTFDELGDSFANEVTIKNVTTENRTDGVYLTVHYGNGTGVTIGPVVVFNASGSGGVSNALLDEVKVALQNEFKSADTETLKEAKTYTDTRVNSLKLIEVCSTLPSTGSEKYIYLVPKENSVSGDWYDEYVYTSNGWEWITARSVSVDLTDYAKKDDLNNFVRKSTVATANHMVYAKSPSGGQLELSASSSIPTFPNNSIPLRNGTGDIAVPSTPFDATSAVSRQYVDEIVSTNTGGSGARSVLICNTILGCVRNMEYSQMNDSATFTESVVGLTTCTVHVDGEV